MALRAWLLGVLASEPGGAGALASPPAAGAATWELFVEAEGCAIPVSRLLAAVPHSVDDECVAAVEAGATSALKRVLAARAQLRGLGELARRHATEVIALKGAIPVAGGRDIDLEDIDLLVRPEAAEGFAGVLDSNGYHATRGGSPRHLGTRFLPGGVGVDLHLSLDRDARGAGVPEDLWAGAISLEGAAGLLRPSPSEHAWYVLTHIAVDHPDRRGRVRDLLVIAHALGGCSEPEIDGLRARMAGHEHGEAMGSLLAMGLALNGRSEMVDAFRHSTAAGYHLLRLMDRLPLPEPMVSKTWSWAHAFVGSPSDRRAMAADTSLPNLAPSRYRIISSVEARAPRIGWLWRAFWRWLRLPFVILLGAALAGLARRRSRRSGL